MKLCLHILGATPITLGAVPDGTGQIWLDNVNCRGTETRLIDCPANALGSHNCVHAEDAGVNCMGKLTHYFMYKFVLSLS